MIIIPDCTKIDFRSSEDVNGFAHILLILYRNLDGVNAGINTKELQNIKS